MVRSRSFSIYLLKAGFDEKNSLKPDHDLEEVSPAKAISGLNKLYILDSDPTDPWWKSYFGINETLQQVHKAAIAFIKIDARIFALTFGHVYHNLLDESYEYDFGLRVTLNCVDPLKIKNTDTVDPESTRRQRTQVSIDSDITFFDFDRDSAVLRALTGKVKDEHKDWFKSATGSSSLKVSSPIEASKLTDLLKKLLTLYKSIAFKTTFPDIQNISPVKDPLVLTDLNKELVTALKKKSDKLILAIPDIVDYSAGQFAKFSGTGASKIYADVGIDWFYEYLEDNSVSLASISHEELRKKYHLHLTQTAEAPSVSYTIARSLIFETTLTSDSGATYHYLDNNWYRVDTNFLKKLTKYLDGKVSDLGLIGCNQHIEADYNAAVAADTDYVCLDTTNISPKGQKQVEPCDLYTVRGGRAALIHVKIYKDATGMSHLFNQGANSIQLLKSERTSLNRLKKLIKDRAEAAKLDGLLKPTIDGDFSVMYAIITKNDPTKKSLNLPLFSKISLRRSLQALALMEIPATYGFVSDTSPTRVGTPQQRKNAKAAHDKAVAAKKAASS